MIFNGDFHWFDHATTLFTAIDDLVAGHMSLRGNVETELVRERSGDPGCGCSYPASVAEEVVERSNRIMARLQQTARGVPRVGQRLNGLPMHLTACVGGLKLAIVHGDAHSLSGWDFAHDMLDTPDGVGRVLEAFRDAGVDAFASSHTCLPVCRRLAVDGRDRIVINNGAAGMPNFRGTHFGITTRISVHPGPAEPLYALQQGRVRFEAIPLRYDYRAWQSLFLELWPHGSPGYLSYLVRIANGPDYGPAEAAPRFNVNPSAPPGLSDTP